MYGPFMRYSHLKLLHCNPKQIDLNHPLIEQTIVNSTICSLVLVTYLRISKAVDSRIISVICNVPTGILGNTTYFVVVYRKRSCREDNNFHSFH